MHVLALRNGRLDSAVLPFSDVPWAYADVGNALTVNSRTTTTKITLYYSQD
jgi:hypothetical protein